MCVDVGRVVQKMEEIGKMFISRKLDVLALSETDLIAQGEVVFGVGERKKIEDG